MVVVMDNEDVAWVAGFLEGEADFWKQTSSRGHVRVGVRVTSTDEDVLRDLERLVPHSRIRGPRKPHSLGKKPEWFWELGLRLAVVDLLGQIRPWMGKRRTVRIDELLAHHASRPALRAGLHRPASHGTRTRFGRGCRCGECREADNAYQRQGRQRRKDRAKSEGTNDGRILCHLAGNPGNTACQMAEVMRLDEELIRADLKRLRLLGRVRRWRIRETDAWSWNLELDNG